MGYDFNLFAFSHALFYSIIKLDAKISCKWKQGDKNLQNVNGEQLLATSVKNSSEVGQILQ